MSTAKGLLGIEIERIVPIYSGRNNAVYRIDGEGQSFALKFYSQRNRSEHDRFEAELKALTVMAAAGIDQVPSLIARDRDKNCIACTWLDGNPVEEPTEGFVDQLVAFLVNLQEIQPAARTAKIQKASAACLTCSSAIDQLEERYRRLAHLAKTDSRLKYFVGGDLKEAVSCVRTRKIGTDLFGGEALPPRQQVLSPSDFGFHNAICTQENVLNFFDFEYFGWDDPVKLVSDLMLHPGNNLDAGLRARAFEKLADEFQDRDPLFTPRFEVLYAVYGLIWCTILLNCYFPEWDAASGQPPKQSNLEDLQALQLKKSQHLLHQTMENHDQRGKHH